MRTPVLRFTACLALAGGGLLHADTPAPPALPALPAPEILALGATIYQADCATFHRTGKAGSPMMGDLAAWTPRLAKGLPTLVKHAINGYSGPAGDEMPSRGGNDDLTDAQVAAAVAYIVSQNQTPKTDSPPPSTP